MLAEGIFFLAGWEFFVFGENLTRLQKFDLLIELRKDDHNLFEQPDLAIEVSCSIDPLEHVKLRIILLSVSDLLQQLVSVDGLLVVLIRVQDQDVELFFG